MFKQCVQFCVSISLGINTLIFLSFLKCADTRAAVFPAVQMRGLPHDRNNPTSTMGHLPGVTKTHPARHNPEQSAFWNAVKILSKLAGIRELVWESTFAVTDRL